MASPNQGRRQDRSTDKTPAARGDTTEKVVFINRCAKVVKGGRRFSFSALIVAGDHDGKVGVGFGKANEVAEAIRKASEAARKSMEKVSLHENTIPHETIGEFGGGRVLLRPASPGTGVIAGGGVRAVVEAAGIRDVLAKSLGSSNHANVVKATIEALRNLRRRDEILKVRGIRPRTNTPGRWRAAVVKSEAKKEKAAGLRLHNLRPRPGARHRVKRLGCGESSGHGKTSGKGHKGQKARSGGSLRLGFEGGQMPLIRRLPKRGFNNAAFHKRYAIVNLSELADFKSGSIVNEESLRAANLVRGNFYGIKILGDGELKHGLTIQAEKVSAAAREKIEKAGGTIAVPEAKATDNGTAEEAAEKPKRAAKSPASRKVKPKKTKVGKK